MKNTYNYFLVTMKKMREMAKVVKKNTSYKKISNCGELAKTIVEYRVD